MKRLSLYSVVELSLATKTGQSTPHLYGRDLTSAVKIWMKTLMRRCLFKNVLKTIGVNNELKPLI